ncbi:transcriptional regulator [Agrilactobacillus composti DSM 18527 = JCM 14202]|uniref:Transcriptional regulator n=1 Tax=Agrilactobacillus composti DSM 18527 = JCM 14202 TaxID=1423734 RepID=X0PV43_9LACO|nr:YutD family protein [Agrilactobacillus composti]KRM34780.1 transcriptional regulator [Agrilactobacillus composti DSM 18527 = JCM 14202]GAF42007.1 hypothetical protein JCM14202_4005 [Agrilactobacillus composti DSM 18527 = JCM 14202]
MSNTDQTKDSTAAKIDELLDETVSKPEAIVYVRLVDDKILINGVDYEMIENHKDAFNVDVLNDRYSDILNKYDYIVGDWGYDQLRLRGFYRDNNHQANRDQLFSTVEDYLYEYCNFGCAYFVLHRLGAPFKPKEKVNNNHNNHRSRTRKPKHKSNNNTAKTTHSGKKPATKSDNNRPQKQPQKAAKNNNAKSRRFTVRKLDESK